jgi:hypothetical protein
VHISRLTVFIALPTTSGVDTVAAYLESQLTKIEPPKDHTPDS